MVQLFPVKTPPDAQEVIENFIASSQFGELYPDNTQEVQSQIKLGLLHDSAKNLLLELRWKSDQYEYKVAVCRLLIRYAENLLEKTTVKQYWVKAIAQETKMISIHGINSSYDGLVSVVRSNRSKDELEYIFRFDINWQKQIVFVEAIQTPCGKNDLRQLAMRKAKLFVEDYLETIQGYDPYFSDAFATALIRGRYLAMNKGSDYIVYRDFSGYSVINYLKFYASPFLQGSQLRAVCLKSGNIELED